MCMCGEATWLGECSYTVAVKQRGIRIVQETPLGISSLPFLFIKDTF